MNLLFQNFSARIAAVILCAHVFASCSKDKKQESDLSADANISVSILGVTDMEETPSADALKLSTIAANAGSETAKPKIQSFDGFDAILSVEKGSADLKKVSIGNSGKGLPGNSLMAAAVPNGVKYRLLLYRQDGTFVSSTQMTSGTLGNVLARKGFTYNWYAVSYNNTTDVPDVDHTTPVLTLPVNQDVLYASGSITIPSNATDGTRPLGIVFNHRFARVGIELNTMGMFADINSATVSVTGATVAGGTLNLRSGQLTSSGNSTATINYNSFSDVEAPYKDRKIAYFYTSSTSALSNLNVAVSNLSIRIDNNTDRVFTTTVNFPFNFTPTLGQSYRAVANLIESPITLAGVRWARMNLYYQAGHNPYRFLHTYRASNNLNSFFSFRGTIPQTYGAGTTQGGGPDPCALVYPAGVWRQPTSADFSTLTGVNILLPDGGGRAFTSGSDGTGNYFEYTGTTATGAPYPNTTLRFYMNGNGSDIGLLGDLVNVSLGNTFNAQIHIWSGSTLINVPGLASLGALYYEGIRSALTRRQQAQILNITLLGGLNIIRSDFKNVRCVRAI